MTKQVQLPEINPSIFRALQKQVAFADKLRPQLKVMEKIHTPLFRDVKRAMDVFRAPMLQLSKAAEKRQSEMDKLLRDCLAVIPEAKEEPSIELAKPDSKKSKIGFI